MGGLDNQKVYSCVSIRSSLEKCACTGNDILGEMKSDDEGHSQKNVWRALLTIPECFHTEKS